jgi:hypothetical protein
MASFVLTNAYVKINSVDLSDHVRSVKINYSAETPDNTAMGATTHSRLPGLSTGRSTSSSTRTSRRPTSTRRSSRWSAPRRSPSSCAASTRR